MTRPEHDRPGPQVDRPLPPRLDPRAGRTGRNGAPPVSTGSSRRPVERPAAAHPGTRLAIGARVLAGVLSLVLLVAGGWGWYLGRVAEASVNRTNAIPTSGNEGIGSVEGAGAAMNLLLVGNDSRASATEEELGQLNTEATSGMNTDTMMLVHVPADGSAASFVSFPRDSYVQIPGHGWDKLNAAYAYGYTSAAEGSSASQQQAAGAQLLIRTISALTGLQIDHYAEVDLLGFFNLSSVIGGVDVNLCQAAQDDFSGIDLPAGSQTISGEQALAFVRQRHGLPRGDFDRIVRQQTFIAGMIRKILSENTLLDLGKQRQLVEAAADSVTVDQGLNLFGLANQLSTITPGSIDFQTIPYVGDSEDDQGRYILQLEDTDALHEFFGTLSAEDDAEAPAEPTEAPETLAPEDVPVEVLNGSGTSGLAAGAAEQLTAAGYPVTGTGNADGSSYTTTEVRFATGDDALAAALAAMVPGAVVTPSDDATPGTVQLVLGSDFDAIGEPVTAPAAEAPAGGVQGEDQRTAADTDCIN